MEALFLIVVPQLLMTSASEFLPHTFGILFLIALLLIIIKSVAHQTRATPETYKGTKEFKENIPNNENKNPANEYGALSLKK